MDLFVNIYALCELCGGEIRVATYHKPDLDDGTDYGNCVCAGCNTKFVAKVKCQMELMEVKNETGQDR